MRMEEGSGRNSIQDPAEQKNAGYLRRFGLWVAIALALVFATIAYSMVYDALIGRITPTIAIREGTIERFLRCDALIIRDEELVEATSEGAFNQVAKEGERLSKGGVAARIGGSAEPEHENGSSVIAQEAEEAALLFHKAEAVLNDARLFLSAKEAELAIYANREDPKGVARLESEVAEARQRVSDAMAANEKARDLYSMKAEAAAQEGPASAIKSGGVSVRTKRQAVVSFNWDGLEEVLSPDNPGLLEVDFSILSEAKDYRRQQGDMIAKGGIVFREVGSLSTDVLLQMEGVDPDFLTEGRTYRIRFTKLSSEKVPVRLKSVKLMDGGFIRAYFSMDRYVTSMTSMRSADTELLLESYSGLVLPARAIATVAGKTVVYVLRKDKFIQAEVEVLGVVEGEAAVKSETLRQGDKIRYDG